jgi:hypothetical protein
MCGVAVSKEAKRLLEEIRQRFLTVTQLLCPGFNGSLN